MACFDWSSQAVVQSLTPCSLPDALQALLPKDGSLPDRSPEAAAAAVLQDVKLLRKLLLKTRNSLGHWPSFARLSQVRRKIALLLATQPSSFLSSLRTLLACPPRTLSALSAALSAAPGRVLHSRLRHLLSFCTSLRALLIAADRQLKALVSLAFFMPLSLTCSAILAHFLVYSDSLIASLQSSLSSLSLISPSFSLSSSLSSLSSSSFVSILSNVESSSSSSSSLPRSSIRNSSLRWASPGLSLHDQLRLAFSPSASRSDSPSLPSLSPTTLSTQPPQPSILQQAETRKRAALMNPDLICLDSTDCFSVVVPGQRRKKKPRTNAKS